MLTTEPDDTIQVGPPGKPQRQRSRHRLPSWGLKATMALTGALWVFFVAVHLFGNLKVFQGPDAFNTYAAWLRAAFYPLLPKEFVLWALRIALAASLIAHVGCAVLIWWRARGARGPHRARLHGVASWSSWLMPLTGVALLVFIVVHLLDLTLGTAPIAADGFTHPGDSTSHAYQNLVASFARAPMAWFYVAIMVLLALHIAKGATTMAADLGVMGRRLRAGFTIVGAALAIVILLGNAAIPVLVQLGVLA